MAIDLDALKKKYKAVYANEAITLHSLHQLHMAFSEHLGIDPYKGFDPEGPGLAPGVLSMTGFMRAMHSKEQESGFHVLRISGRNAIYKAPTKFQKKQKSEKHSGTRTGNQALDLYMHTNARHMGNNPEESIGPLKEEATQARGFFVGFLKGLTAQESWNLGELPLHHFANELANIPGKEFAKIWMLLFEYKIVDADGEETNGVDQFFTFLRLNGLTRGEMFGRSFQVADRTMLGSDASDARQAAIAKANIEKIAKIAEKKQKTNFHEQFYLLSRLKDLEALNRSNVGPGKSYEYKNFSYLRSFDPSMTMENALYFSKDQNAIFDMTPLQLAALVPYFKLYLVHRPPGEKEETVVMPFQGTHLNLIEVLSTKSRDKSLGFKSFDWAYEGKYYELQDKIIRCSLKLFGDNLGAFNAQIKTLKNGKEIKFEHLLAREADLSFRAVCGWSVPTGAPEDIIPSRLKRALRDSFITLDMDIPLTHTFNFNQDGTFDLEINYVGRLTTELQNVNLLETKELKKAKDLKDLEVQVLKKFKKANAEGAFKDNTLTDSEIDNFALKYFANSGLTKERIKKTLNSLVKKGDLSAAVNAANRLLIQKTADARSNESLSNMLREIDKIDRVFYFSINPTEFKQYLNDLERKKEFLKPSNVKKREDFAKIVADAVTTDYGSGGIFSPVDAATAAAAAAVAAGDDPTIYEKPPPTPPDPDKIGAAPTTKYKRAESTVKAVTAEQFKDDYARKTATMTTGRDLNIPFIFFGDIVDAALGALGRAALDEKGIRIVLGGVLYRDNFVNAKSKGEARYVPLVDVPISIRNYSAFIHKKYVKKAVTNIDLNSFLTDAFNSLIKPVFSGKDSLVDLPAFNKTDMAIEGRGFTTDKSLDYGQVPVSSLQGLAIKNSPLTFKSNKTCIFFNGNKQIVSTKKRTKGEDSLKGVAHIALGSDRGLIKHVSFSKREYKYAVTGRLVSDDKGKSVIDKLREPYDVTIEMFGNNRVLNGSQLYLTPSVPGQDSREMAKRLGLGGYYTVIKSSNSISEKGFVTTVTAMNAAHPDAEEAFVKALVTGERVQSDEHKAGAEAEAAAKSRLEGLQAAIKKKGTQAKTKADKTRKAIVEGGK